MSKKCSHNNAEPCTCDDTCACRRDGRPCLLGSDRYWITIDDLEDMPPVLDVWRAPPQRVAMSDGYVWLDADYGVAALVGSWPASAIRHWFGTVPDGPWQVLVYGRPPAASTAAS